MDLNLNGKIALVTGGARDTGAEIATTLAAEGATVVINYRSSQAEAEGLVETIKAEGGQAIAYQADVTDLEAVQAMVKAIVEEFGRIDILVNNAGLVLPKSFPETTPEQWKTQIDIGLYAVIHTCHAVTPYMTEQGDGRIVNLTGDSARVGEKYLSITASSRGGVLALTKSLAKELGKSGIRVNAVSLGLLETSHSDKAWLEANRSKIERQYALRRIGLPQDVAPMVVFLASDATSWVTGQIISVNGGYRMVG